jgi:hypothetical protein
MIKTIYPQISVDFHLGRDITKKLLIMQVIDSTKILELLAKIHNA